MPESRLSNLESIRRTPRVSVIVPAYNAERFIGEAIESVLAQTFDAFELIVVDDGSTDATAAEIARYDADTRLRWISEPINRGRAAARNRGLAIARCEYIAFLDADDRCMPERLSRQVDFLDTHPHIDIVGTSMRWIDAAGKPSERHDHMVLPTAHAEIACRMLFECSVAQPTILARRAAFEGFAYTEDFGVAEDYELWARMIGSRRFANWRETLVEYRAHDNQASACALDQACAADHAVYALQLAALGIAHDTQDLIRHECLFKFKGRQPVLELTGAPLDIDYLRWARDWLTQLQSANVRSRIYPEPAFSHMLAQRWLFACRKTARQSGWLAVGRQSWATPLRTITLGYGWKRVKAAVAGLLSSRPVR